MLTYAKKDGRWQYMDIPVTAAEKEAARKNAETAKQEAPVEPKVEAAKPEDTPVKKPDSKPRKKK